MGRLTEAAARTLARVVARLVPARLMSSPKLAPIWEAHGYHVVPRHFYGPIPDLATIPDNVWDRRDVVEIDFRVHAQLELLDVFAAYRDEYEALVRGRGPYEFVVRNGAFESVDAEMLFCMVRHAKPRRVVEIGAGHSTRVVASALALNAREGSTGEHVAIDPYPSPALRGLDNVRVVRTPVQNVSISTFDRLEARDILFIDSSHVLKLGSDVAFELFEVLPRLRRGVLVHFHDIFLPLDYPRDWVVDERRYWNEQYALRAFLAFNDAYRVIWSSQLMHLDHAGRLRAAFSSYDPETVSPGSFWIERVGARTKDQAQVEG